MKNCAKLNNLHVQVLHNVKSEIVLSEYYVAKLDKISQNLKTQINSRLTNLAVKLYLLRHYIPKLALGKGCRHFLQYNIFNVVVALVDLEKIHTSFQETKWTLPTFCRAKKMEKNVKYLKFRVALDSLRTVWRVFDTIFHLTGLTIPRSSNFGDDGWHVCR